MRDIHMAFRTALQVASVLVLVAPGLSAQRSRTPLREVDIADITTLVMLEDRRQFDSTSLSRILHSTHPEVRRRAALSIGRIANPRGRVLLEGARADADTAVAATVVFSTGQLADTASLAWLNSLLTSASTPPTVATEAACALGKIRTAEAHAMLSRYLSTAAANARSAPAVREALLSIGRYTFRGDLGAVMRWTTSTDEEIRWRATWALFRPRDPAAVPALLRLSQDASPSVRNWATRGLTAAQVDSAGLRATDVVARLGRLTTDADRTVRTEAMRTLVSFSDTIAWSVASQGLNSPDSWISVSAAEGLGRQRQNAAISAPRLATATAPGKSSALRVTALASLVTLAADAAFAPAVIMARDTALMVRVAAVNFLRNRGAEAKEILAILQNDAAPEVSGPARQAYLALTDTAAAAAAAAARGARAGGAGGGAGARGGGRGRGPVVPSRTDADYRKLVERWIVPDYNGAPRPRAEWATARGSFEIELYAGDVPIGVEDFIRNVESGNLVGVDFSRVVPDFVDQQRGITGHPVVRDEVNRIRLTRANLSWASAGLDTGRPGYTLGHTPQPHNEGGFTSLGRVVRGMDVVDRVELGDRIVSARMVSTGR